MTVSQSFVLSKDIVSQSFVLSKDIVSQSFVGASWARIAALVPVVVSCAEAGDEVAYKILLESAQELASSVKAVVGRLGLCGQDGKDAFPLVLVSGVLEANTRWDVGKEAIKCISKYFPGMLPIRLDLRLLILLHLAKALFLLALGMLCDAARNLEKVSLINA
ncbi:unnamed protein product [Trifolium pratense]|uniref:Uncharacterized protein n=1 Tax=Trifolium pratense TaxID=57577 RepID=A0ACB0IPU6_TRIPR|nr:unnamed protein product [Trifolium pratense]